ncbi:ABC transporter permease [Streptomyces hainanensis]|uniref:ABC transporter permease n=1 Tax=Streptomyces hainanensis TaxID=402648 RepID=A0A4R4T042_9ACTN|nr:ABC transporter permease [Streptomyces hainanensis]TDC68544.1 ABC transporter permease [Streptomyces hainanensis]
MLRFALRRATVTLATLLVVSLLAFLIPYLSGGDPARAVLRSRVSDNALDPAAVEALKADLGLDRPLLAQYVSWLGRVIGGDFGLSFTSRGPVSELLGNALGVSVTLAVVALGTAVLIAVPLGTLAATRHGSRLDHGITLVTQGFVAIPEYWLAPVLVLVFSRHLGWLPSAGWETPASLILPALTLTLRPLAYVLRITRAAMIDVLAAPYITAARSRGLGSRATLLRHGLRNGLLPVLTLSSVWFAGLLGGSVVIEVLFNIPGMGQLVYRGVVNQDIPVIQGGLLCVVALAIAISTLADLLGELINPTARVRHDAH